jgi:hypothetical protein
MVKVKRPYSDATIPYVPADELDIMAALLREKPPPARLGRPKKARKSGRKRKGPLAAGFRSKVSAVPKNN